MFEFGLRVGNEGDEPSVLFQLYVETVFVLKDLVFCKKVLIGIFLFLHNCVFSSFLITM